MPAAAPIAELERLAALRRYGALGADPEEDFDDIARLAAQLCGAPMAAISLVDADHQWFKARVGLQLSQTPRDASFCAHVVRASDALVVPDTREDSRFADNPLVTGDPWVRSYAGAPLRTPDAHVLGALCVLDREPRALTGGQVQALQSLSRQAMAQLELRRARALLAAEQARAEQLLLNALPAPAAERLKRGEVVADARPDVAVLFADIADFTPYAAARSPAAVVNLLGQVFSTFDALTGHHGLEKIKTIGDAYMAAGGLFPRDDPDHNPLAAAAELALDMQRVLGCRGLRARIGLHAGPAVAGIIGSARFSYDVWGETVNLASRLESQGVPGRIQVSASVFSRLRGRYAFERRGLVALKGLGRQETYLLLGSHS